MDRNRFLLDVKFELHPVNMKEKKLHVATSKVQLQYQLLSTPFKHEELCRLRCDAVQCGKCLPMFRKNVLPPSSALSTDQHASCILMVAFLVRFPTLKMEAVRSLETSVNF
jgi:hypothetical protein